MMACEDEFAIEIGQEKEEEAEKTIKPFGDAVEFIDKNFNP